MRIAIKIIILAIHKNFIMKNNKFGEVNTMKLRHKFLFSFVLFYSVLFSQTEEFTYETAKISAGAEFSAYLQKTINSNRASFLSYREGVKSTKSGNGNSINAITPILGVDFDTEGSTSGYYHIPPDPSGVAGPSHLVAVNNTSIRWSDKNGGSVTTKRLGKNATTAVGSFFESVNPVNSTFDPKVIYDQYNNRFVVVTLERRDTDLGDPVNSSRILVAVSATSDPNGAWYFTAFDSNININGVDTWADYPGFAVNSDAIFITVNMFTYGSTNYFKSTRLWVIEKSAFYGGGAAVVHLFDPQGAVNTNYSTMQPAHMFGTEPTDIKTYLSIYSGISNNGDEYLEVIDVKGSYDSPTFKKHNIALSNIDNTNYAIPAAPQSGTTHTIDSGDRRALSSVWRNDSLYVTFNVRPPSGPDYGQATAHWVKMSTDGWNGSIYREDQGNIGGEDIASGTYTFYPTVAVNSNDEMVIGFSASGDSIFCGAYYAGRIPTDAAGTTPHTGVLKAGTDYYIRTFGSGRNRWGDYTGISVDPADGTTFWLFNQYAMSRGTELNGEDGRWATAFGKIVDSPLPVELTSFSGENSGNSVLLNWQTATELNNYGFEIERKSERISWNKIGFVEGNGTSNSPKEYSFTDKVSQSGKYSYRLKQIDINGSYKYSNVVEVNINVPEKFELKQNYPNPFNPTTTIEYSIPTVGAKNFSPVQLKIYDVLGREITTLVNKRQSPGNYSVKFNASNLPSGTYFYRIHAGSFTDVKKMILLK